MGGADVDHRSDVLSKAPLLCVHAHLGHSDVVALLLDHGAQVQIFFFIVFKDYMTISSKPEFMQNLVLGCNWKIAPQPQPHLRLPVLHS